MRLSPSPRLRAFLRRFPGDEPLFARRTAVARHPGDPVRAAVLGDRHAGRAVGRLARGATGRRRIAGRDPARVRSVLPCQRGARRDDGGHLAATDPVRHADRRCHGIELGDHRRARRRAEQHRRGRGDRARRPAEGGGVRPCHDRPRRQGRGIVYRPIGGPAPHGRADARCRAVAAPPCRVGRRRSASRRQCIAVEIRHRLHAAHRRRPHHRHGRAAARQRHGVPHGRVEGRRCHHSGGRSGDRRAGRSRSSLFGTHARV